MANSTAQSAGRKPKSKKPSPQVAARIARNKKLGLHPDFELFPHGNGYWCKKVNKKLHYFGKIEADPKGEAAAALWADQRADLIAGRTPRVKAEGAVTVADVVNKFLTDKEQLRDCGELAPRTYARYVATGKMLLTFFDRNRQAADLGPDDFSTLRASMAKRWGPVALGNEIQIIRSMFKYASDPEVGLLDKPIILGKLFKKPSAKTLRMERAKSGPKLFTPEQIKALLSAASPNVKAMTLLGINGGMGNGDLGNMTFAHLDLDSGWLNYPRPKTGIPRRVPLWKETVAAIRKAIEQRPEPANEADKELVFIGRRGESYRDNYRVAQEYDHAAEAAKVEGRSFYDLRRTFQTIGEGAHDLVAVQSIMGHAPASGDMSSIYRQRVDDSRLLAVTEHVRTWLYGADAADGGDKAKRGSGKVKSAPRKSTAKVASKAKPRPRVRAEAEPIAEAFQFRIVG